MLKIVVATQEGGVEDQVSPVFGRCQTYTIVDAENGEIKNAEVTQNRYANAMSGAGIQAAGFVANQDAEAVISGNFGPNVASVFNQAGIKMVPASGMSVREAVLKYINGELEPVSDATSAGKRVMGGGRRGMGMGRGMRRSPQPMQSSRQPQQGQQPIGGPQQQSSPSASKQKSQPSEDDRIVKLEERIESLENQLSEIVDTLEGLKY